MSLNQAQTNALHELSSGQPVQVFPTSITGKLIEGGYARAAVLDPTPKNGQAINLTARGRGVVERTKAAVDMPAVSAGDDA